MMTMARRMGLVFAAVLLASARAVDFGAPVVPEPPQAEALASPDLIKATMEPKGGTAEAKAQMVAVAAKAAAEVAAAKLATEAAAAKATAEVTAAKALHAAAKAAAEEAAAAKAAALEAATLKAKAAPPRPTMRPKVALRAMRPWSFTATVGPVALGAALSYKIDDVFSLPRFLLTMVVTLAVHGAGNLMNTLFDFTNGKDSERSSDLTLVKGVLLPDQVTKLILGCYGAAALAAAPLYAMTKASSTLLSSLLVAGAASAYVYTGGPGLKYKALGDLLISSTFGPLLVGFSFLTQSGSLRWRPLLASLPITLHIEAILHANNARDVEEDAAQGIKTLAAFLGPQRSKALYAALIALPFGASLYAALRHSLMGALPLLAIPKARQLIQDYGAGALAKLPMKTAKFQFLFGMLFVASVLIPSPSLMQVVARAFGGGRA
jgi:1,4-dihydroxy-2-naphthoate octaprenyltransferase